MVKKDKTIINQKKEILKNLTFKFCKEHLDEEYLSLCDRLIDKMARKRNVPFLTGRMEIWAAAVIHALGTINFLFDKSFEPHATVNDISDFFGTSKSTTGQKSKIIRDMFRLDHWDQDFSTQRVAEGNPYSKLAVLDNGFIVSKDFLESLLESD